MPAHRLLTLTIPALLGLAASLPAAAETPLERGTYLMDAVLACANCHTPRGPDGRPLPGMDMAGGFVFEDPGFTAYSKNITPDPETGIGTWTDEEIIRAVREGKTKEGELIGPPMPVFMYNRMSDDDAQAMVAYLRQVTPVHNEVRQSEYSFPLAGPPPAMGEPAPPREDKVAYGGYLATLAHCFECHTTPDSNGVPDMAGHYGAGGFVIRAMGKAIPSANITPDPETGLGNWTDEEIKKAFTEGVDREGKPIFPVMPYSFFKNMTPEDADAIVAYLRSIPPISYKVERVDWRQ